MQLNVVKAWALDAVSEVMKVYPLLKRKAFVDDMKPHV